MTPPPPASDSGKTCYKILLAEDNDMNRELATRLLTRRGHEVVAVIDGQLALDRYQQEPFDVILMDMEMPVMDGMEAARCIRALEQQSAGGSAAAHIPIIAMTAFDQQEMEEQMKQGTMDGLITKPINTKELDDSLRTIVEQVRAENKG